MTLADESDETALIAVQGPKAVGLVRALTGVSGYRPVSLRGL